VKKTKQIAIFNMHSVNFSLHCASYIKKTKSIISICCGAKQYGMSVAGNYVTFNVIFSFLFVLGQTWIGFSSANHVFLDM